MTNTVKNENITAIEILYNAFFTLEKSTTIDEAIMDKITDVEQNICDAVSRIKSQNENDQRLKLKLAEYYLLGGQKPNACQETALNLYNSLVSADI